MMRSDHACQLDHKAVQHTRSSYAHRSNLRSHWIVDQKKRQRIPVSRLVFTLSGLGVPIGFYSLGLSSEDISPERISWDWQKWIPSCRLENCHRPVVQFPWDGLTVVPVPGSLQGCQISETLCEIFLWGFPSQPAGRRSLYHDIIQWFLVGQGTQISFAQKKILRGKSKLFFVSIERLKLSSLISLSALSL